MIWSQKCRCIVTAVNLRSRCFALLFLLAFVLHAQDTDIDSGAVSLGYFIEQALSNNPELLVQREKIKALEHAVTASVSLPYPEVSAGIMLDDGVRSVEVKQSLPWPTLLTKSRAVARSELEASRAKLQDWENEVLMMVRGAYARWYAIGKKIQFTRESITLLKTSEKIALASYAAASKSQVALLKLQVELAMLEDALFQLQKDAVLAQQKMFEITTARIDSTVFPPHLPQLPVHFDENEAIDLALTQNPELKAERKLKNVSEAKVGVAKSSLAPGAMVSLSFDVTKKSSAPMLMAGVNIPLWIRSRIAQLHKARALEKASAREVEKMRHALSVEAVTLHRQYSDVVRRINLLNGTLIPLASQSLQVTQTEYSNGTASMLDFLDGQRTLLELKMKRVDLEAKREEIAADMVICCLGNPG